MLNIKFSSSDSNNGFTTYFDLHCFVSIFAIFSIRDLSSSTLPLLFWHYAISGAKNRYTMNQYELKFYTRYEMKNFKFNLCKYI